MESSSDIFSTFVLPNITFAAILPTFTCFLNTLREDEIVNYTGYQVFRTKANTSSGFQVINEIYNQGGFDFFQKYNDSSDILVCPWQINNMKEILQTFSISYNILIEDVGKKLEMERQSPVGYKDEQKEKPGKMNWTDFQSYETIYKWMYDMQKKYPENVFVFSLGKSYENRTIKGMKITKDKDAKKLAGYVDGTMHAREWASTTSATYIGHKLIKLATKGGKDAHLLDRFNFYVVPVTNLDGYIYSRKYDRFWRKTRNPEYSNGNKKCIGVDLNRNFDIEFNQCGASTNPCDPNYSGPKAESEPETKAFKKFIKRRRKEIKFGLNLHSYGQAVLVPTLCKKKFKDHKLLDNVAVRAAKALYKVNGKTFKVGRQEFLLGGGDTSGAGRDWIKIQGVKFVYGFESRDLGKHGFVLPRNRIIAAGKETFAFFRSLADDAAKYYKIQ